MVFTGTNQQQDTRFSDKENKLMKQMEFEDCLNKRVDMSKVKLDVLRPWISRKITDILHIEDDVIVEFVYNQLEENKYPCPKKMQIDLTGFLSGCYAPQFMGELWSLLLSAQESDSGIPDELIQQKKEEILKREEE